ncbi:hypothetical protein, partial [Fortiea sp. LEGE XX443]|uniref:hypothetical protein n=1 Tax=Fortiea sp. LEGE XX443 TaxID=1828611 RepID=UPI001D132C42
GRGKGKNLAPCGQKPPCSFSPLVEAPPLVGGFSPLLPAPCSPAFFTFALAAMVMKFINKKKKLNFY